MYHYESSTDLTFSASFLGSQSALIGCALIACALLLASRVSSAHSIADDSWAHCRVLKVVTLLAGAHFVEYVAASSPIAIRFASVLNRCMKAVAMVLGLLRPGSSFRPAEMALTCLLGAKRPIMGAVHESCGHGAGASKAWVKFGGCLRGPKLPVRSKTTHYGCLCNNAGRTPSSISIPANRLQISYVAQASSSPSDKQPAAAPRALFDDYEADLDDDLDLDLEDACGAICAVVLTSSDMKPGKDAICYALDKASKKTSFMLGCTGDEDFCSEGNWPSGILQESSGRSETFGIVADLCVEYVDNVSPMVTSITEHSGEGLPASVVESVSMLKHQPALTFAALWYGLMFFFELHQCTQIQQEHARGESVLSTSVSSTEDLHMIASELDEPPASVIDSLQRLLEVADMQRFAIQDVYRVVLVAFHESDDPGESDGPNESDDPDESNDPIESDDPSDFNQSGESVN
eukprot:gene25782-11450_t